MAKIKFNKSFSIGRVVAKLVSVTLALYVGNTIMNVLGSILNNTAGQFNLGFKLIGWTVENNINGTTTSCSSATVNNALVNNCITAVSGTGVLAVVGLIGLASIVMEFVEFRMN